ncbi:MAG: hypothetical protein AAF645_29195 [Myxococcota bacterium]
MTMLISASASAQNGVFIPDVQLEAPADLQPSLDECDGECERELRLRLGVDVDLELRIELAELLRDIPPPPKRRYAVPLLITAVGVGSLAASIALLTNQDTYETSTGTRVGATLFAVGGLAITSGLIALMFRVLIFHGRRAERRRALLDAGLVRW